MKNLLFMIFVFCAYISKAQNTKALIGFNFVNIEDYSDQFVEFSFSTQLGVDIQLLRRSGQKKAFFDYGLLIGYNEMDYEARLISGDYPNQNIKLKHFKIGIPLAYSHRIYNSRPGVFDFGIKLTSSILITQDIDVLAEFRPMVIGSYGFKTKANKLGSTIDFEIGVCKYLNFDEGLNFCALIGYGYWF